MRGCPTKYSGGNPIAEGLTPEIRPVWPGCGRAVEPGRVARGGKGRGRQGAGAARGGLGGVGVGAWGR